MYRRKTLLERRDELVQAIIREEIEAFISGERKRYCPVTGKLFKCRSRNHFFSSPKARKAWYRGQFVVRD